MALNIENVFEARRAAQYTGDNSADLNAEISDFSIVSETPTQLVFTSGGTQHTVARNGYVSWYQGSVTDVFQNRDDYEETFSAVATLANHVHDLVLTTGPARQAA